MKLISPQMDSYLGGTWQTNARCLKLTMRNHQPEIVNVSNANPAVVTTKWAHGWQTGYSVQIINVRSGLGGIGSLGEMLNFGEYIITVLSPTTFSIPVDATALDLYDWQGIARRIIGFTTYLRGLTFEGIFFNASKAYLPTSVHSVSDMTVSNFNLLGVLSSEAITDADIQRDLYANARLDFFMVNYRDLTMGKITMPGGRGNFGQVVTKRKSYEAEHKALEHYLQAEIGHIYSPLCRADLGYDGQGSEDTDDINLCKVKVDPPFWRPLQAYEVRPQYDAGIGAVVKPTTPTNPRAHFKLIATTAGALSGAVEPTWDPTVGNPTADGALTWEAIYPLTLNSSVSQVLNQRFEWIDLSTLIHFEDQFYQYGVITWLTGANIGMKFLIKNYRGLAYPIVGVTQASKIFRIAGDQTGFFFPTQTFTVWDSTGNDSTHEIIGVDPKFDTFVIEKDFTARFVAGFPFEIDGNPVYKETWEAMNSTYDSATQHTGIQAALTSEPGVVRDLQKAVPGGVIKTFYTIVSVTYVSGTNRTEIEVAEVIPSSVADGVIRHYPKTFELFTDTPNDIQIGDQYEIRAGCDKTLMTCFFKFDNVWNFRGEPFVPGMDKYMRTPDSKP